VPQISHNVGAEHRAGVDRFRGTALDRSENAMWGRKLRWENWFKALRVAAAFLEAKFAMPA
jgi:hypothetical protein